MKFIGFVIQKIYAFWVILVFSVFMILFLPGMTLPFMFGNRFSWIGYRFLKLWSGIFSFLTFIHYEFKGQNFFRKKQSYIYVSNHTSFLDLPGLSLFLPGEFRPLAKKELKKIPVFGWIAQGATVIVDRSSPESRKKSLALLKAALEHGISILLFAEGTQNRTKEILQPFKDGAFRIALDTQKPILPMVIIGAGKLMPPGKSTIYPGKIKILAGPEIPIFPDTDLASLKSKTFNIMKEMIQKEQTSH